MNNADKVTNVVIAGLGGQGILKASDILCEAVFQSGFDVKKSEIHGMSQRGGSVTSDVRFGQKVWSPMVPSGEADYLLVFEPTQVEPNQHYLAPEGKLIDSSILPLDQLPSPKSLNLAMLGALSVCLPITPEVWLAAIETKLPAKILAMNLDAFALGRDAAIEVQK